MLDMRVAWIILLFQLSCFALQPAPPLNIASITLGDSITLEDQTKALGLQDALNSKYKSPNGAITVFPDACIQRDGTPNCTAACRDKTQMFSNLKTLHNCAVFPHISVQLANNDLTADARRLAEELKIKPSNDGSSLPSEISNAIQSCLLDSCKNNEDCAGTLDGPKVDHSPNDLTGRRFIDDTYLTLCLHIPAYVNADVGGIGVFISYVMQMGLALLAFLVTVPWASIFKGFRTSFYYCLGVPPPQHASGQAKQHPQTSSDENSDKYPGPLTGALVGFHKAQCWFMLATNIAGLVVETSGGLQPESLQQLYNTYVFIKVLAIGGYLPITFTLLNLHMIKRLSWYPIALSIATIAVATTTLSIKSPAFNPTVEDFNHITALTTQNGPPTCASRNLVPWCYSPRQDGNYFGFDASSSGSGANGVLVFSLITLSLIITDHFCRSDDPKQRSINRRILKTLGIRAPTSKPLFRHARTVLRVGTPLFHLVFFWLYVYAFYLFGEDLYWFRANHVYDPSWGFGQIVAITVWAPTLGDYLWDQIRGVPKGSEHKISRMYEVVRRVQERGMAESAYDESGATKGKELPY